MPVTTNPIQSSKMLDSTVQWRWFIKRVIPICTVLTAVVVWGTHVYDSREILDLKKANIKLLTEYTNNINIFTNELGDQKKRLEHHEKIRRLLTIGIILNSNNYNSYNSNTISKYIKDFKSLALELNHVGEITILPPKEDQLFAFNIKGYEELFQVNLENK